MGRASFFVSFDAEMHGGLIKCTIYFIAIDNLLIYIYIHTLITIILEIVGPGPTP